MTAESIVLLEMNVTSQSSQSLVESSVALCDCSCKCVSCQQNVMTTTSGNISLSIHICAQTTSQITNYFKIIFLHLVIVSARRSCLLQLRHRFICQITISFHTLFSVAFHVRTPCRNLLSIVTCFLFEGCPTYDVVIVRIISVFVVIVSPLTVADPWVHPNNV